jgi:hypothetical protein
MPPAIRQSRSSFHFACRSSSALRANSIISKSSGRGSDALALRHGVVATQIVPNLNSRIFDMSARSLHLLSDER